MSNTMSLKGGLDMYAEFGERYLSNESPEGRKVIYLQKNGLEYHQEHANKYFKKNDVLTVKEIYVGRSSSEVEFVEYPNQEFNTVMFADVLVNDDMSNFKPDMSKLFTPHAGEKIATPEQIRKHLNNNN